MPLQAESKILIHDLWRTPELFRCRLCFSVLAYRLLHCMGSTQRCELYDFTKIKCLNAKVSGKIKHVS